jgi:cbb3-type cytochrome oxidase subunit 1
MNQSTIATELAPPFRLVLIHFLVGLVAFLLLHIFLVVESPWFSGHYFQPHLLGLTHLAALGWITLIMMGAMYQLVPVVLQVRIWSVRLAEITFWIFCIGALGLVSHMWTYATHLGMVISAALVVLAYWLFILNMLATMAGVKEWDLTGLHLLTALLFIFVASALGLLLAFNLYKPFLVMDHLRLLGIHAHLAFLGWVTLVVMGVAYKLIPMFSLAHGVPKWLSRWAYVLTSVGTVGLAVAWYFGGPRILEIIYSGILTAGIFSFLVQMARIFKNRMRKKLDVGLQHTVVSFVMLGLLPVAGVTLLLLKPSVTQENGLNWPLTYGFLGFYGFVGFIIVGQLYKIFPFLVWFHRYSDRVGHQAVPLLKDMFSERLASSQFWLMLIAFVVALIGVLLQNSPLLRIGFGGLLLSNIFFSLNMITILRK